MIRTLTLWLLLPLGAILLLSADSHWQFLRVMQERVEAHDAAHPEEKVFLHLDKGIYAPGEDIWFKAYVLDRSSRERSDLSQTLKVLLMEPGGTTLLDTEFEINEGMAQGTLTLPERSDEGPYKLIAWSSWMRNQRPGTTYHGEILVRKINQPDLLVPNVILNLQPKKTVWAKGEAVELTLSAQTPGNLPTDLINLHYQLLRDGQLVWEEKRQVLNNGEATWRYPIPAEMAEGLYYLKVAASHRDQAQEQTMPLQIGSPSYQVQFMPEGGDLVTGIESKVAWRAENQWGQGLDIQGTIVDTNGKTVVSTATIHDGIGSFYLKPAPGQAYSFRFNGPDGQAFEFALPEVRAKDYVISYMGQNEEHLFLKIQSAYSSRLERYFLRGTMQNSFCLAHTGRVSNFDILKIPVSKFKQGIVQFTLFDEQHRPRAERLVYVQQGPQLHITARINKSRYITREQVAVDISVTDEQGRPVQAQLSLAATDTLFTGHPSMFNQIGPYVQLKSELSGNWHLPADFDMHTQEGQEILDLLMLSYGWRRLEKKDLDREQPHYPQEYIVGRVYYRGAKNRPADSAKVQVIPLGLYNVQELRTDEQGYFYVDRTLLTSDLEGVIIRGLSSKDKENVRIELNIDQRDPYSLKVLAEEARNREIDFDNITYQSEVVAGRRYIDAVDLRGYQVLSEILIQEKRIAGEDPFTYAETYRNLKSNTRSGVDLVQGQNFIDILRQVTSINYVNPNNGNVYFRGFRDIGRVQDSTINTRVESSNGALFVVNGTPYGQDYRLLNFVSVDMIEELTVIKSVGTSFAFGGRAQGGVVLLKLSENVGQQIRKNTNYVITDLYDDVREFYAPAYTNDSLRMLAIPDFRSTLHWEPMIETDAAGKAEVRFYNSDRRSVVLGAIEGVGQGGRIGSARFRYEIY